MSDDATSRMDVLLVHPVGITLYTAQLANALSRRGHDVTALVGQHRHDPRYYDEEVTVEFLPISESYVRTSLRTIDPRTYADIYSVVRSVNPDVIHVNFFFLWITLLLPVLGRRWPLVVTDHEPNTDKFYTLYGRLVYRNTRRYIRRVAETVIVHTESLKDALVSDGTDPDDVAVVPHGAYTYYTRWSDPDVESADDTVLFFGHLERSKGLEYLIDAEPLIRREFPDVEIVIAGKGDISPYLDRIDNRESFRIVNEFVSDEEVARLFQRATVVALPYTEASQSGVFCIACAFERPVVVTDVGGLPDDVEDGETGLVVPPRDAEALAEATLKLLTDPRRREAMARHMRRERERRSWENVAGQVERIYEEVR